MKDINRRTLLWREEPKKYQSQPIVNGSRRSGFDLPFKRKEEQSAAQQTVEDLLEYSQRYIRGAADLEQTRVTNNTQPCSSA